MTILRPARPRRLWAGSSSGGRRAYLLRRPTGRKGVRGIEPSGDAELVADFVARTPGALDRAYRTYGRLLYSVARQALGADDDAQDCVHDTLMRVWLRPETFRPERGSLRAYLSVCVRNDAIGRKRAAARHATIERRLVESAPEREESYEFQIDDPAERARLREAFAALPAEQRQALECAYFGYLSHGQISEKLGVPLGTIKSRIAMGLRKLKAALESRERNAR